MKCALVHLSLVHSNKICLSSFPRPDKGTCLLISRLLLLERPPSHYVDVITSEVEAISSLLFSVIISLTPQAMFEGNLAQGEKLRVSSDIETFP